MAGVRHYCYINIGLKSLAPINGLTRLLALASCDCLHCKRRFCCELSERIITNWWRHGRQLRQVWSEERTNFVTTHYSRVKPHSLVVADYWKSVGLVTGSNWTCFTVLLFVDELGLLIGPAIFIVNVSTEVYVRQKTSRSFWSYGAVGSSGSTDGQSLKKSVNETRTATSRQKSTSLHLLWDLNACTTHQHCVLTICVPTCINWYNK